MRCFCQHLLYFIFGHFRRTRHRLVGDRWMCVAVMTSVLMGCQTNTAIKKLPHDPMRPYRGLADENVVKWVYAMHSVPSSRANNVDKIVIDAFIQEATLRVYDFHVSSQNRINENYLSNRGEVGGRDLQPLSNEQIQAFITAMDRIPDPNYSGELSNLLLVSFFDEEGLWTTRHFDQRHLPPQIRTALMLINASKVGTGWGAEKGTLMLCLRE